MEIKPGYLTTEFWATVVNAVVMFIVAFGVLDQSQADELVALALPLIGAILPIIAYVWGRAKIKAKAAGIADW